MFTDTLSKVFGGIWIVMGIAFMVRPAALLKRIQKKGARKFRHLLMALGLFLSYTLISFGFGHEGLLPKALLVFGVVGVVKSLSMAKGAIMQRFLDLSLKLPENLLRFGGLIYIAIGLVLIFLGGDSGQPAGQ